MLLWIASKVRKIFEPSYKRHLLNNENYRVQGRDLKELTGF